MIKPYTKISLTFISKELNIQVREVEELLVSLILDDKINGHIDQINQVLVLETRQIDDKRKFHAVHDWSNSLDGLIEAFDIS